MLYAPTLPFGKYGGRQLTAVPSAYLLWALRTVKLGSGLRAAVASELQRRGVAVTVPPLPEPPPSCWRCGGTDLEYTWQQFRNGDMQVRRGCKRCGKSLGFAPQVK